MSGEGKQPAALGPGLAPFLDSTLFPASGTQRPGLAALPTTFPSPLPGFAATHRSGRRDTAPKGRKSPFCIFGLPVSSRLPDGADQERGCPRRVEFNLDHLRKL